MKTWQRLFTLGVRQQRAIDPAMRLGIALALALTLAALAAVPAAAGPKVACPTTQIQPQCIDNLAVTPHGTYADISFFLTTAKLATVTVSTVAPNKLADGTWSYTGLPTTFFAVSPTSNAHTVRVPDLDPHHTYVYLISAPKAAIGNDAQRIGSFMTLTRHVSVTFTSIHVTDDSDSLSAGDLTFWFFADGWLWQTSDGTPLSYPLYDGSGDSEAEVNSGDTIWLPTNQYRTEIAPAPPSIVLEVYGRDDDCGFGQLCTEGIGPGIPPTSSMKLGPGNTLGGSDSDGDWATAAMPPIDLAVSGPGESFTTSINWGTENYSLKFEVAATIKVWYA